MAINKKSYLRKIIALALAAVIISATVLSVAALTTDSNAADNNGTDKDTLSTSEINTDNILDLASIELDEDDQVIRTDNNGIISLTILKAFPVTINNKGTKTTVKIAQGTVEDALNKANITLDKKDSVTPSLETKLTEETVIKITESVNLDITLMGETNTYEVPKGTVKEALAGIGVEVDSNDKLNVSENEQVYEGMEIIYVDVAVKEETETCVVDYKTKKEYDSTMAQGESKITRYGVEGEKLVTNQNIYEDGVLVSSTEISSEVTKQPVTQIMKIGTKMPTPKHSGAPASYKKIITGSGTAYTAAPGSLTATGVKVKVGCVAVNPNVIPYGSKLYIVATDGSYVYGYATAVDTGGALMNGSAVVDLFMNSYADCAAFGRRDVTIYVI